MNTYYENLGKEELTKRIGTLMEQRYQLAEHLNQIKGMEGMDKNEIDTIKAGILEVIEGKLDKIVEFYKVILKKNEEQERFYRG